MSNLVCIKCEKPAKKCICGKPSPKPIPTTVTHKKEYVIEQALKLLRSPLPVKPTAKHFSDRFEAIANILEVL